MCGIVGVVNTNPLPIKKFLLEPLQQLEYRGYDSCGFFAKGDNSQWSWEVSVGEVKKLFGLSSHLFSQGIAHTRWATHGVVCEKNSHPQMSGDRIYVVHNGVVDNYLEVKASLVSKGYVFESDTDTEVIAHLINFYVSNLDAQYPTSTAVCMAMIDLKGKFSFIAADSLTDTMVSVNNGRPLIFFQDDDTTTIASDVAAFTGKLGGQIYYSREGEILEMNGNSQKVRRVSLVGGNRVQEKLTTEFFKYSPEPVKSESKMRTFMEAEIYHQNLAVLNTLESSARDVLSGMMIHPDHVGSIRIIGCGTSYHAAQMGAMWMSRIAGVTATAHIASEFANGDPDNGSLFVFVSQSGETADTLAALGACTHAHNKTIAVCNTPQSELVRRCKASLHTRAGTERSVASTKAFMCQLVALLRLSIAMARITGKGMGSIPFILDEAEKAIETLPALIKETIDSTGPLVKQFGDTINPKKGPSLAIFLGREYLYPIALEGALKLAEIAYIPALTYFTGELKHGPLALVDCKTPVIVTFSPAERNLKKMFSSLSQVQARGGRLILVSNGEGLDMAKTAGISAIATFSVPTTERYSIVLDPFLLTIPLQLLAHEIAYRLKKDVDRPRNLAKSVTIE